MYAPRITRIWRYCTRESIYTCTAENKERLREVLYTRAARLFSIPSGKRATRGSMVLADDDCNGLYGYSNREKHVVVIAVVDGAGGDIHEIGMLARKRWAVGWRFRRYGNFAKYVYALMNVLSWWLLC